MADKYEIFRAVDKDNSGRISAHELQSVLSNGTGSQFNLSTCQLLILMFDRQNAKTIDFDAFSALFDFVNQWRNTFQSFDRNGSKSIDYGEFRHALVTFGYRLPDDLVDNMCRKFDKNNTGTIEFDDFIRACSTIQILTKSFQPLDVTGQGRANMTYDQFIRAALSAIP